MSTPQTNTLTPLLEQAFILRCRICRRQVSKAVFALSGDDQVTASTGKQLLPRQRFILAHRSKALAERIGLDHGVFISTEDVFDTACDPGSVSCCGYSPHSGPNLRCAKGHIVGSFNDDCLDPDFAHFSLEHAELYPLPKDQWPIAEPNAKGKR